MKVLKNELSILVPCYNEENVLESFLTSITTVMTTLHMHYEIIFINDGSTDDTLNKLLELKVKNKHIKIINFSRNFGKEAALTAGLDHAEAEAIIPIDADLQDPPYLIVDFVRYWKEGYDVVLAKRIDRSSDNRFKRLSAKYFYRLHNIIGQKIPENVGDYRLMSKKVVNAIKQMPENQRFMKGIFSWVGFKTKTLEYTREERVSGNTSFSVWKLWNLALEGITSFSTMPLRIWLYIGTLVSSLSFIYGSFIILRTLLHGTDLPGYASLLVAILFLGGLQLIGIGVLGEYIGRIYMESKNRPVYIVESLY
ncbi:MAG: glycosyltransferase [Epsilonproteobacteria bacterium]|nr:MAG: glycosyltransferase [Campylobacterota bacterium]